MLVPDHDVGILAGFERADPRVDLELLRRIDRHERKRLVFAEAAPVHRLGRLGIEAARVLGAIGVDRDEHAAPVHDRSVVGNRVLGLDFVRPPVGEGRAADAVLRHFVGDLVALEHVLEGGDLEAHLFGQPHQHQRFVRAVGVRMHQPPALEDFDQRLELQISPRHRDVLAGFIAAIVLLPLFLVSLGAAERIADHELGAGPCDRVAPRAGLPELPHVLGILAQGKLDPGRSALENEAARVLAPAQLDDLVLAADRVRAPVQDVRNRQAAREVAMDRDVGRIEDVLDARHRAHRRAALVDRFGGDVRVRVDDARAHEAARRLDDVGAGGNLSIRSADRGNLAIADDHDAVLNGAPRDGEDRAAANRDHTPTLRERGRRLRNNKRETESNENPGRCHNP